MATHRQGEAKEHFHGYYGRGFGFWDPFWSPYWYAGPWGYGYYGWYGPGVTYAVQPAVPKDQVMVTFHIRPARAEVMVDGQAMGRSHDFDSVRDPLWLKPGEHVIEITKAGYQTLHLALQLEGGESYDLSYGLNRGGGIDGRSSETGTGLRPSVS